MSERMTGTVKMLNRDKMFGFLRRDDGEPDVFFHKTSLRHGVWEVLKEDESRLAFEVVPGKPGKGPRAEHLELT